MNDFNVEVKKDDEPRLHVPSDARSELSEDDVASIERQAMDRFGVETIPELIVTTEKTIEEEYVLGTVEVVEDGVVFTAEDERF